ncbi:MAG: hypothetical protein P4N59_07470 [Negativicutes bacterium]|nr:hypothetical protein [Negativicutes bacterium]
MKRKIISLVLALLFAFMPLAPVFMPIAQATISNAVTKATYIGNGVSYLWAIPFQYTNASQVNVVLTDVVSGTVTPLTTGWDIDNSGNVRYPIPGSGGTLLTSATEITVYRKTAILQPTQYTNQGGFYPKTVEGSLDNSVMMLQEMQEQLNRSIVGPVSSTTQYTLPGPVASTALGWDPTGTFLANVTSLSNLWPQATIQATVNTAALYQYANSYSGDFNALTTSGVYITAGIGQAHAPNSSDNFIGQVVANQAGTTLLQMFKDTATSASYYRLYASGAWSAWSQVLTSPSSSAQGDILYNNGTAWTRLAAGTSGQYLQTQGASANPQWATVTVPVVKFNFNSLQQYKAQVTSNTAVSISAANNPFTGSGTISLTLNTGSSGANGLDTGSLAASQWYNTFLAYGGSGTCSLISLSATAPTLPTGYTTSFIRTGAVYLDSSKNLMRTVQNGRKTRYVITASTNTATLPSLFYGTQGSCTAPTWIAISLASVCPPTASSFIGVAINAGSASSIMIAPNNTYGAYNSTTNPPPVMWNGGAGYYLNMLFEMGLESASVYAASQAYSGLFCAGWEDNL